MKIVGLTVLNEVKGIDEKKSTEARVSFRESQLAEAIGPRKGLLINPSIPTSRPRQMLAPASGTTTRLAMSGVRVNLLKWYMTSGNEPSWAEKETTTALTTHLMIGFLLMEYRRGIDCLINCKTLIIDAVQANDSWNPTSKR